MKQRDSEVLLLAEVQIAPGREEEGLAQLERFCVETHAGDPGCELYALHRVPGEPSRVIMIERWASAAAREHHRSAPHTAEVAASGLFVGPPRITVLEAMRFGDRHKGAL